RTGMRLKGWSEAAAVSSVVAEHPGARILGLHRGRSAYPVYQTVGYSRQPAAGFAAVDAGGAAVLTRLTPGGEPDLAVSANGRFALFASDVMRSVTIPGGNDYGADIERYDHRRHVATLIVNVTRRLLGLPFFEQPLQKPHQQLAQLFHAYAAGREYVLEANRLPRFAERLPAGQLAATLRQADVLIREAARSGVRGDLAACRARHTQAVQLLADSMKTMTPVQRFLFRGWHASNSMDDNYGGGIWGCAENRWLDELIHWTHREIELIRWTNSRRLMDYYGHDLELMKKYYPQDMRVWAGAIAEGLVEPVHGLFSASCLPIYSGEVNVRQFRHGLAAHREALACSVTTYITPGDHFDYHPQLPQLLRGFGYERAVLRSTLLGQVRAVPAERIRWRGLDGTEIDTIPQMEDLSQLLNTADVASTAKADEKGYSFFVTGPVFDAGGGNVLWEHTHTVLDSVAPVSGTWATLKEVFQRTPPAAQSFAFDADGLHNSHLEMWARWAGMCRDFGRIRAAENQLLAAEKLLAIGSALGRVAPAQRDEAGLALENAWKKMLVMQDHMLFGYPERNEPIRETPQTVMPGSVRPPSDKSDILGTPRFHRGLNDQCAVAYEASRTNSARVLADVLRRVAGNPLGGPGGESVCVFNPLGWPKHDGVELEREFAPGQARNVAVTDHDGAVPFQILESETHPDGSLRRVKLLAEVKVPPLGWRTLAVVPAPAAPPAKAASALAVSATRLENDFYLVELDAKHGGVRRVLDKELQRDVLSAGEFFGNELFSPEEPRATSKDATAKLEVVERGPVRAAVRVRSEVSGLKYDCRIALPRCAKRVDFVLTVDYGGGKSFGSFKGLKGGKTGTGLFAVFPVAPVERVWINQPFGIYETKQADQVTGDFIEAGRAGHGLALIHRHNPAWRHDRGLLWMTLSQAEKFRGPLTYPYSLYSHAGDVHQGEVFRVAQSVNTPFVVQPSDAAPTAEASFLSVSQPNIALSALYPKGRRLIARFHEAAGRQTVARLASPLFKGRSCVRVELDGRPLGPVTLEGESARVEFKPWQIVTLRLEDAAPSGAGVNSGPRSASPGEPTKAAQAGGDGPGPAELRHVDQRRLGGNDGGKTGALLNYFVIVK
ncbi:MAG: hypothetical protein FJ388_09425, partial [Verrucomicrobia bacterium]|nr:hypothetical protein [Verrucomicrobiota bacterium]